MLRVKKEKNGDIRCQVFSTASDDLYIGKSHDGTVIMALDIGSQEQSPDAVRNSEKW